MKILLVVFTLVLLVENGFTQTPIQFSTEEVVDSTDVRLYGTMLFPQKKKSVIVLFIAGSGPTDRNGNSPIIKTDCTKILAEELAFQGIASLRYDKRGIGQSKTPGFKEEDFVFETMIEDAQKWIRSLKNSKRFTKVVVAGHSEGSLVGMVAAKKEGADAFISLAGAGRPIDQIIKEQVLKNPNNTSAIVHEIDTIISQLKDGKKVETIPPYLTSLFRPSVQPFMISWLKYAPAVEIEKLKMPVLIIQGTTDIQVSLEDSELLQKANSNSSYRLIKGMNHIFRDAPLDQTQNIATYYKPELPISKELISSVTEFILKLK